MEICSTDGVARWHTATTKKGVDGPPQLTRIGTLSVDFVVPEFFTLLATEREVGATVAALTASTSVEQPWRSTEYKRQEAHVRATARIVSCVTVYLYVLCVSVLRRKRPRTVASRPRRRRPVAADC